MELSETLRIDISEALVEVERLTSALDAALQAFRDSTIAAIDEMVQHVTETLRATFDDGKES